MSQIAKYYDEHAQEEWDRLDRYRMEFAITMNALSDYLPPAPATVLDVGGGPGRYSIALASLGHTVSLVDISMGELEIARRKARDSGVEIADFVHASGTDLSAFPDDSFNAVLLMGPLYHLLAQEQREKAVTEAWRVLKPKGVIFASFITRYALIRDVVKHRPDTITNNGVFYHQALETGVLTGPAVIGTFTDAYAVLPAEVRPLMEREQFTTLDLIACHGLVSQIDEKLNELDDDAFNMWVHLMYRLSRDPSIYGAADHLLYVGRK